VGRENVTKWKPAGEGYSFPGRRDGYKVVQIQKAINATCLEWALEASLESYNPACFLACNSPNI
jgi:hypothetical protein